MREYQINCSAYEAVLVVQREVITPWKDECSANMYPSTDAESVRTEFENADWAKDYNNYWQRLWSIIRISGCSQPPLNRSRMTALPWNTWIQGVSK